MDKFEQVFEQFKVTGKDLVEKIKELIHEGNVRRIIIKDERGHTFMEIPLTVATIGIVAAPILTAVGAVATLIANFHIVVERAGTPHPSEAASSSTVTDSSVGATEGKVDMRDTVPERINKQGSKVEDMAGTGEHDSRGG